MSIEWYLLSILVSSFLLTGALRVYALKKNVIDIPNERSSHTTPTPRGGGVSIVLTYLFGLIIYTTIWGGSWQLVLPIFIAGVVVAFIGFLDDHQHVNSGVRLTFHFLASVLIVFATSGLPIITFFGIEVDLSYIGDFIAVIACVWVLNLFNFMDGIDGIAGIESTVSTFIMGLISLLIFENENIAMLHFMLCLSSLGFLFWNFPPAKIFMGDAGSGFLGLMLAALLLVSAQLSDSLFWGWLVMLGVFIVDATYTLIRRLINGHKPHEAHRSHAYQIASRKYGSHLPVTLSVLIINLLWLAPIAFLIAVNEVDGFAGLLIAYIPLLVIIVKLKAGSDEKCQN